MRIGNNIKWYKVAASIEDLDFGTNHLVQVDAGGKQLCISNFNGKLSACAANCPHASGPLAEGYIDALGNIVCPEHRYKFNLQNGRNVSGEGYHLKTYPVEVREEGIFVRIEKGNFLSGLLD